MAATVSKSMDLAHRAQFMSVPETDVCKSVVECAI